MSRGVSMQKNRKIFIIGDSAFAEIAFELFSHDSDYEVVGFSVEAEYLKQDFLFGLPVVPFETVETVFDPAEVEFYAAITYGAMNRLRTRLYQAAKAKGFRPASYVSSRAFVWRNVKVGEHCFIFENNTVQPFCKIGDNVVLWSGNHIGHHSVIENNCFVASQVVVSGYCNIGQNTFLGVNATVANNVNVGADNWIGMNASIGKSTGDNLIFKGSQAEQARLTALRYFKVEDDVDGVA